MPQIVSKIKGYHTFMICSAATNSSFPANLLLVTQVHCSSVTINDFAVQAEMVAVETSIDVSDIL